MSETGSALPNPYESPPIKSDGEPAFSVVKILVMVVLGILLVPAAAIAFFATCLGTVAVMEGPGNLDAAFITGMSIGSLVGLGTIGGGTYLLIRLARYWRRKPNSRT